MKKKIASLFLAGVLTMMASVAMAYDPGQRTYHILGSILNSDYHPVHLVVEQRVNLKGMVDAAKYASMTEAERVIINRTEYNEVEGKLSERNIKMNGEGKITQDITRFIKDGKWYSIDRVGKTYDAIPVIRDGMRPFAENFVGWFSGKPEAGVQEESGLDFDRMVMGVRTLTFFYEKDSLNWVGYEVSSLPPFKVVEVSDKVDESVAFALPDEEYKRYPDNVMRKTAERSFIGNKQNKKSKKR